MKQRDQVAMTTGEVAAILDGSRKLQLATINRDGSVHLVTMFYVMLDGQIAFWTYRSSQKARNLARDPRVTCLVEAGEDYFDLRGVQVAGVARCIEDPEGVLDIGRRVAAGQSVGAGGGQPDTPGTGQSGAPAEALEDYVTHAASKRFGYIVEPIRVISWDHRKLLSSAT